MPVRKSDVFQSLSGFPMSCNCACSVRTDVGTIQFQSLSGFPMSCNAEEEPSDHRLHRRFNPYRVFQ